MDTAYGIVAVTAALVLAGCTTVTDDTPVHDGVTLTNFQQIDAACAGDIQQKNASTDLTVTDDGATVDITGAVQTPVPCYELDADLEQRNGTNYDLHITSHRVGEGCVTCAGAVSYQATVAFTTENGSITIYHDGEQVSAAAY